MRAVVDRRDVALRVDGDQFGFGNDRVALVDAFCVPPSATKCLAEPAIRSAARGSALDQFALQSQGSSGPA